MATYNRKKARLKRKIRIRKKIKGTSERPRLCVFRSLTNLYVQVVDDVKGHTLIGVSSLNKEIKSEKLSGVKLSEKMGQIVAEQCKSKNITTVVFDKSGFKYHGRVKALADAARKGGLTF